MNSIQAVSPSYHGSTEQSNQDRMVKFAWKMNDLAKKVSRVALIAFFAMHCLIDVIYNLGTNLSLTSGIVATSIFAMTNIISMVKATFEYIERKKKEDEEEERRKAALRLEYLEAERLEMERVAALKEQEALEKQQFAEEAQRVAEQKAEAARQLVEQKELEAAEVAKRMQEQKNAADLEINRIQKEKDEETARLQTERAEREREREAAVRQSEEDRERAQREMEVEKERNLAALESQRSEMEDRRRSLQTQYDSALNSSLGLQGQVDQLKAFQENAMKDLDQANADKLEMQRVQQELEAEKNRLEKELERTNKEKNEQISAREDLQTTLDTKQAQIENYLSKYQEKIKALSTADNEITRLRADKDNLTSDLSKSSKDNQLMLQTLRGLFVECLCGDTPKEFVQATKEADAHDKSMSALMRRTHQKYNGVFYTFLEGLSQQGIDLNLGELEFALKKEFDGKPVAASNTDSLMHRFLGWVGKEKKTKKDQKKGEPHPPNASKDSGTIRGEPAQASSRSSSSQSSLSSHSKTSVDRKKGVGSTDQIHSTTTPNPTPSQHSDPLVQGSASSSTNSSKTSSSVSPFIDGMFKDGTKINFRKIIGDDDCGFVVLGTTQKDVREALLVLSKQDAIRRRLCDEVYEAMTTNATAIITKPTGYQSLRAWKEKQDSLDQSLREICQKYGELQTFAAELGGDMVYQESIDWLKTDQNRKDDTIKLQRVFLNRKLAIQDLKSNCISGEVYYHLYCREYLNRLGCESAMIYAEQKKKFPLYIWEQLPNSPHLSLRDSYSDPSLDQSNAVHLLYSMGRNHFDRLIVLDQPALAFDEVDSPSPPSSSSSSTTGEGQKTPPEETTVRLAEFQAHATEQLSQNRVQYGVEPYSGGNSPPSPSSSSSTTIEEETIVPFQAFAAQQPPKNRVQGGTELDFEVDRTLTDESAVLGSGSAGVTQDQPDDTQTKPAVEPAVDLPHSTGAETLNSPSDNEDSDDDPKVGDSISESTSFLSNSNDGESHKTKPKKRGFLGSLFG